MQTTSKDEERLPDVPTEICINICAFAENFMDVRVRLPARDLSRIPGVNVILSSKQLRIGDLAKFQAPRIIVAQRPRIVEWGKWLDVIHLLRQNDCLLIYEIDDHPHLLQAAGNVGVDRTHIAASASAVQTSTPKLADFFSMHNPETSFFPNSCHDLPIFREKREGRPNIFYGALNRGAYSPDIARRISPILRRHGAGAHVVSDRAFFDALDIENKTYHNSLGYASYLNVMRQCDILLSPLQGLPGEAYKSDVKFVEASAQGLATIASPLVYGDTISPGTNGLIANEPDDWTRHLDDLLASPPDRIRMARRAWDYVRAERHFANQAPLRIQWYLDLWERREAIWEEIGKRISALGGA